jgi:hypothetical protein
MAPKGDLTLDDLGSPTVAQVERKRRRRRRRKLVVSQPGATASGKKVEKMILQGVQPNLHKSSEAHISCCVYRICFKFCSVVEEIAIIHLVPAVSVLIIHLTSHARACTALFEQAVSRPDTRSARANPPKTRNNNFKYIILIGPPFIVNLIARQLKI